MPSVLRNEHSVQLASVVVDHVSIVGNGHIVLSTKIIQYSIVEFEAIFIG